MIKKKIKKEEKEELKEAKEEKEVYGKNKNLFIILGVVLGISVLIFIIVILNESPIQKIPSITGEAIKEQNCRDVQVPYDYLEEYQETIPYTDQECNAIYMIWKPEYVGVYQNCIQEECASYEQVCVEKNFWGNCIRYEPRCAGNKCVKYRQYCGLKIENKEREGATFNLELYKWNQDTQTSTLVTTQNLWVPPLDSATATWNFVYLPTEAVSCWYKVTNNPTRQECKEVIRYKEVTKTRTVTRYKTEQKCD